MAKDREQAGEWVSVAALAAPDWPGRGQRAKKNQKEKSAKAGEAEEAEDMAGEDATCFTRRV